ncbi:hypothetical protein FRC04_000696 [Tulasnella sp. 424]|nr:hypothetical protein FRC04_000696 [Tulasnella sp. 424]KAG8967694.1 hypothetical protein FRC05_001952 [Tulasnella sp. 425]
MTQNWTNNVKATFNACLCSKITSESDDERDRQQGASSSSSSTGPAATGGRQVFARDELEGLLASASSDEDADAMSLHSNVGGSRRNKKKGRGKGKKKQRDAWGVVGRNLSMNSRRSMQMFGWYPFGKPIALPESSDEEDAAGPPREGERRTRTLSNATNDSDAAPLESSDIVSRVTEEEHRKKTLDLMRANFEPQITNEDLEREERELAEQEEAAAVYAFSFPAVPPTRPVEPPIEPEPEPETPAVQEPEPEEEEGALAAPSVADDQTIITDDTPATESSSPTLPRTPLSPASSSTPAATSTPQSHADRIKKAAKEQRRRMREDAARRKKEERERRAEAAAGGFGFEEPQEAQHEFGEFVVGHTGGVGVAWTESDGASSHPSQYPQQPPPQPAVQIPIAPMHGLPLHHQLHPDEHPLSPSDDELMDYGAEYAASRRPRKAPTALMGAGSASGSDRLERMSNGSVRGPNMVPLPASTFGSPRKPTILHRATGSGTLSSHSGLSGQAGGGQQVYYQPVAPVQFQAPPPVQVEPVEFDGVPGGLDDFEQGPPSAGFAQYHHQGEYVLAPAEYTTPQFQQQQQPAYQEFDGIPGGLNARHTRSRAGSVMDLATPPKRPPVPQRSHTSSFDSVGMGMGMGAAGAGAGFPSTGFGSSIGRPRAGSRARTLDSGAAAVMLGRNVE